MSPVLPSAMRPGVWAKVSQMLGPRPSSATAPSIWYEAVAVPQTKSGGNVDMNAPFRCSDEQSDDVVSQPCGSTKAEVHPVFTAGGPIGQFVQEGVGELGFQ